MMPLYPRTRGRIARLRTYAWIVRHRWAVSPAFRVAALSLSLNALVPILLFAVGDRWLRAAVVLGTLVGWAHGRRQERRSTDVFRNRVAAALGLPVARVAVTCPSPGEVVATVPGPQKPRIVMEAERLVRTRLPPGTTFRIEVARG